MVLLRLVFNLDIESLDDLKRTLKETGYSDKAVSEILKWYKDNNSNKRL
jgi:hypothetical protein